MWGLVDCTTPTPVPVMPSAEIGYTSGSFSYEAVNALLAERQKLTRQLALRENELIQIRGICRNSACRLQYAHQGECLPSRN